MIGVVVSDADGSSIGVDGDRGFALGVGDAGVGGGVVDEEGRG